MTDRKGTGRRSMPGLRPEVPSVAANLRKQAGLPSARAGGSKQLTVELSSDLHTQLKVASATSGMSMKKIVSVALEKGLSGIQTK
jgi:predicted HicB family RNase H-like nuclease